MARKASDPEAAFAEQLRRLNLPEPKTEFQFHPTRKWRLDFAWPQWLLAMEVEGGIWVGGAHNRPVRFTKDIEKYNEAVILGWSILRTTSEDAANGNAALTIRRWMEAKVARLRQTSPRPESAKEERALGVGDLEAHG